VFEAMQLSLQALGPAHGKRNSGHRIFPKNKTPDRCEAGVVIKTLLWSKLAANASYKKKDSRDLKREGVLFELRLLI